MKSTFLKGVVLVVYCLLMSSCLVTLPYKSHTQLLSKTDETQPFIEIALEKPVFWLPIPNDLKKIKYTKNYMLTIDFHTKNIEYKRLDSIRYEISNGEKQAIVSGILPILNGELSRRPYSPEVHRAQCTTQPNIVLKQQRKNLVSNFVIYATDANNQTVSIAMSNRALIDHRFRIGRLF